MITVRTHRRAKGRYANANGKGSLQYDSAGALQEGRLARVLRGKLLYTGAFTLALYNSNASTRTQVATRP